MYVIDISRFWFCFFVFISTMADDGFNVFFLHAIPFNDFKIWQLFLLFVFLDSRVISFFFPLVVGRLIAESLILHSFCNSFWQRFNTNNKHFFVNVIFSCRFWLENDLNNNNGFLKHFFSSFLFFFCSRFS